MLRAFVFSGLLLATPAAAQDVFSAPGLIEILPIGDLVGDGKTPSTVQVLALDAAGAPISGLKLKPSASAGEVDDWKSAGGGLYTFTYVPDAVEQRETITLSLKGKTPARAAVNLSRSIPVLPRSADSLSVSANPAEVVLGQNDSVTMSFELVGPGGQPLQGADLEVSTIAGEVTNITNMGGGRFTARFAAPKVNYPHLAVITAVDKRNPGGAYGYAVVPLLGKVDYPVQASPNASVVLNIGGRPFGPVTASPQGKAAVPVIVPPGIADAKLVTVVNNETTEEPIDLRVPETKRVHLFPMQKGIPSDSMVSVPVRAVVLTPDGKPDTEAKVNFTSSAGTLSAAVHEGNGIYRANLTPPDGKSQMPLTLNIALAGSSVQTDKRDVTLVPGRPATIELTADPEVIPSGSNTLKGFAKVRGRDGKGVSDRNVVFKVSGGTQSGNVKDMKGGDYRADFSLSGNSNVLLHAFVRSDPTGNAIKRVFVIPGGEHVINDGVTSTMVTVVTADEFGHPVGGQAVKLELLSGDGALPTSVTTDALGIGQIFYTSGKTPGLVKIRATAGDGILGGGAMIQAPEGVGVVDLPYAGPEAYTNQAESWSKGIASLEVAREGADAAPVAVPEPAGTSDAPIAAFAVTVTPATAPAGSEVTVDVTASDAAGVGVPGRSLDFLTSAGVFGIVSDLGGGKYQTKMKIDPAATGEVKVSIMAPSGATKLVKVPIGGEPVAAGGSAWGATGGAETPFDQNDPNAAANNSTAQVDKPKEPKEPAVPGDHPWFRARVSGLGSGYRYLQRPAEDPGPLLPNELAVGGQEGGKNAIPFGFELDGRIFLPSVPYVGFNTRLRSSFYAIAAPEFAGEAADTLYEIQADVVGRYPFEVGSDQFWVGASLGFAYNDFILFTGCLESDCTVEFEPLGLPGLAGGLEVGAEVSDLYFIGGVYQGLAFATVPYSTSVDVNVGYHIVENVFVDLGFTSQWRRLVLEGADSGLDRGELSDGQNIVKIGVGYAM